MSRIPQPFIDDLLNRVDIVDVVDKRVKLKKTGKNYSACCPFHNEKTPSFTVSQDKQFYYCFGCGASGNALGFIMEFDKVGFIDSVEMLASNAGMQVPKEEPSLKPSKPKQDFKNLYKLLDNCREYFAEQLKGAANHAHQAERDRAVKYLKERGLSGHIAKAFDIGYAPKGWDNLLNKFGLSDADRKALVTCGMVIENTEENKRYDRFRQRIMFPILDNRGRTVGFGGRVLGEENRVGPDGKKLKGSGPKYLNSPETPVFHKGKELYGLYQARHANRDLKHLLVVEGYMDVIALAQYGINNAVATLGTACGEDHLRLAFKYTNTIVFCFDGDKAGRMAAKRALENSLPVMTDGHQIKFLFLAEGQDPDTLVRQIGEERFSELIQKGSPLEEFLFDALSEDLDISTMGGRARLSKLAAPLLNKLPKGVYRELMFELLAQRTGLSQDVLQELIDEPAPQLAPQEASKSTVVTEAPPTNYSSEPSNQPVAPSQSGIPDYEPAADYDPNNYQSPFPEQYALEQSHSPQITRHTTQGGRLPLRAIEILIIQPSLAHEVKSESGVLPGTPQNVNLIQLLEYLERRTNATFGMIIGTWQAMFGESEAQKLTDQVAQGVVKTAIKSGGFDGLSELKGILRKIKIEFDKRQLDKERIELQSKSPLSENEKDRLREIIKAIYQVS